MTTSIGNVIGLALRPARAAAMQVVTEANATRDGCLIGDHSKSSKRGITLLSARQWDEVIEARGEALPWHARRANVLIDAGDLAALVGKRIRVGEVEIEVNGITHPCAHIEEMHGLLQALSGTRGGVYGRIANDGVIRVGDAVTLMESDERGVDSRGEFRPSGGR